MSAITRDPQSTSADHARWKQERELESRMRGDDPKFGARHSSRDHRLTQIVAWLGVIGAGLMTMLIAWSATTTASVDKSVAILLDRPAPVSKAQYDSDRQEILTAIRTLQVDVKDIQLKQARTLEDSRTR